MPLDQIILVRHGESVGNVARERALGSDAHEIDIDQRDADVPLSDLGRSQADDLGTALRPVLEGSGRVGVWTSTYRRAIETITIALDTAGWPGGYRRDERLRDRELGLLDRLTAQGIAARYPEETQRRRYLGKLYYRPVAGESWSDVALRIRSFVADRNADSGTMLVSTHDAVIMLFRYVLEELSEDELMELARASVRNASITRLVRDGDTGHWHAVDYDSADHLDHETRAPAAEAGRG